MDDTTIQAIVSNSAGLIGVVIGLAPGVLKSIINSQKTKKETIEYLYAQTVKWYRGAIPGHYDNIIKVMNGEINPNDLKKTLLMTSSLAPVPTELITRSLVTEKKIAKKLQELDKATGLLFYFYYGIIDIALQDKEIKTIELIEKREELKKKLDDLYYLVLKMIEKIA